MNKNKNRRKRLLQLGCVLLLLVCACGCKAKQKEEPEKLLPADHAAFSYEGTENIRTFTVDEAGTLYTAEFVKTEKEDGLSLENRFSVYDLEGNLLEQSKLDFNGGTVQGMVASGDSLYVLVSIWEMTGSQMSVYRVFPDTWEMELFQKLPTVNSVENMLVLGDYLYLLATMSNVKIPDISLHPEVSDYTYRGEKIVRIPLKADGNAELLGVEFPIAIYHSGDGKLGIYHYTEEKGFCFWKYDQSADVMEEVGVKNTSSQMWDVSSCWKGFVFREGGKLYYGKEDGTEAVLVPEDVWFIEPPAYCGGFLFYRNSYEDVTPVHRLCVADIRKDNEVIRMLTHGILVDYPYGCGYSVKETALTSDEFALKVLAQDRDFDLYVLSSRDTSAYNLKENGAFYPLNDVEGVQEYLDACFPHIKELATNEDGDIWMIPVGIAPNYLMYDKEWCAENGIDFTNMDYMELLNLISKLETETDDMVGYSYFVMYEELMGQYLQVEKSFDTELFRNYIKRMQKMYLEEVPNLRLLVGQPYPDLLQDGEHFCFAKKVYTYSLSDLLEKKLDLSGVGIVREPQLAEGTAPVATLTMLMVNPQSDNLKDVLEYISAYAKYMQTTKDSFLLEDWNTYTQEPIVRELYEICASASVRFLMDEEVYRSVLNDYINGEQELEKTIAEMERRRKMYLGE